MGVSPPCRRRPRARPRRAPSPAEPCRPRLLPRPVSARISVSSAEAPPSVSSSPSSAPPSSPCSSSPAFSGGSSLISGAAARSRSSSSRRAIFAKAAWSSMVSASASSSTPAFSSIHGATRSRPGAGRRRRSVPRQSLAGEQPDRGGKRHFIGASGAQDGIAADPRFGQLRKIAPYAIHRPRTERLDPGDFQSVEHCAGIGVERHR